MKLHSHMKTGSKVRRCLSVLLVLCIVFTSGSPNLASAADTEAHQHHESCYEDRLICEKEEHTEACYEERQTLICMNQGEDSHVHVDSCYETERVLICGLEEHVSERYERVLVCGKDDGSAATDAAASVDQPDLADDSTELESSGGEAVPDQKQEADSDVPGDTAQAPEGVGGTDSATEEGADQSQKPEENLELEEKPDQNPEENPEPEEKPDQNPEEDSETEEKPDQNPEEDSDMDSDDSSELPGLSEADEGEWKLTCDMEHAHTEDCYQQLYCGMIEHTHTGECYDENDAAICEMEEHEHTDLCLLPIEHQQKITGLNEQIAALPGLEALEEMRMGYETGEVSEDEYAAFLAGLKEQADTAYEAYMALDEELRQYVTGTERLLELMAALEAAADGQDEEDEEEAFEGEYRDDKVIVNVTAEPGVIPRGAELSVREVAQQDTEAVGRNLASDQAGTAEAEELNEKYEEVRKELEASVAEDDTKEIAGFLAYDISFLVTDENGEKKEIEPEGNVSVSMDFVEAYLPEGLAEGEEVQIDSIDVVHMKEVIDEDTGEAVLKAEVLESAEVVATDDAELEKAEFVVDSFSIFTISWTAMSVMDVAEAGNPMFKITWTTMSVYNSSEPAKPSTPVTLELGAFCVDAAGRQLDLGGKAIGDITITGAESNNSNRGQLSLAALAPYFSEYTLDKIVLGDSGTQEMSGNQIGTILALNNKDAAGNWKKVLRWKPGNWAGGVWNEDSGADNNKWDWGIRTIYFVYKQIEPPSIPTDPETEKVPEHEKYIKYNGKNDYTLTLNVTGEKEVQDIDILLIVDTSHSMINLSGVSDEGQRYNIVNNALQKLNEDLKGVAADNDQLNINVGIVTFDGGAGGGRDGETNTLADVRDWYYLGSDNTPDARVEAQVEAQWKTISGTDGFDFQLTRNMIEERKGSTNWQAAFRTGQEMLANRPASSRKYVIFLTDGDPTTRYASGSSTITVGSGCATHNLNEGKYGDPYDYNFDAAVNEWQMSPALQSAAQAFVIAVLDEGKVQSDEATGAIDTICGNLAAAIGATKYSGQNPDKLNEIFGDIVNQIQYSSFKDVEIHDTLSEYVEFLEETPTFTVTYHSEAEPEPKPLVDENGAPLYKVEYDTEAKTVVLKVLNGGELEDGVTYSISFRVKPTEKAVREYIQSGYPHVGEPSTDAPDNDTSSEKPGFHSNCEERAKVYYNYNENGVKTTTYLQPVVQVDHSGDDDIGITKEMGAADQNGYPITIQIKCGKIENNILAGSTGAGWTVTDDMAPYTHFISFKECTLNGHQLTLAQDGSLVTEDEKGTLTTVATYCPGRDVDVSEEDTPEMLSMASRGLIGSGMKPSPEGDATGRIIWYLNPELADVVIDEDGNGYCSYSLTYYVHFSDSGETEVRNTNSTTYIEIPGDNDSSKYLYPEKMPFFVNIVGNKKSAVNDGDSIQGAAFNVYRDAEKTRPIAQNVRAEADGHFAFQLGQSDFVSTDLQDGRITVYLEETEAPAGYERDEALHPLTVQVADITYLPADGQEKANPGIWDTLDDQKWGSVAADGVAMDVRHDPHGISPDFLDITSDSGKIRLEYYNTKPWKLLKTSTSNHDNVLAGAEFALYRISEDGGEPVLAYTGISDADGYIDSWKSVESGEQVSSALLAAGDYELRETKAPGGYAVSEEIWLVKVSQQGKVSISVKGGASVPGEDGSYPFRDEVLYSLPSTGGIGIYWYLASGTLLMLASALTLYRCKRKSEGEVLRN